MKTSFASYHELTEELAKLPKPAPGLVRVYRGQTKDFGVMLPTGLRAKADARDPIWQYCAMAIALRVVAEDANCSRRRFAMDRGNCAALRAGLITVGRNSLDRHRAVVRSA